MDTSSILTTLESKKIIFVLGSFRLGGAESQALLLADELQKGFNAKTIILGFGQPGRLSKLCQERGIEWHCAAKPRITSPLFSLVDLFQLALLIRKLQPNMLLPYSWPANLPISLVWRFSGAKWCIWNQRDVGIRRKSNIWLEELAARLIKYYIANSEEGVRYLERIGASPTRIRKISNGFRMSPPSASREEWRAKLGIKPNDIIFTMIANLSPNKDHITLLKAWKIARKDFRKECFLVLAGRYDSRYPELKSLAYQLDIQETVQFIGEIDDVSGLLFASDVGVHSSLSEGLPNSVLEMMGASLPVLGTNIPGIREAVGENNSCWLADPGNEKALAHLINKILEEFATCEMIGKYNHQRVEEHFSVQKLVAESSQFYYEVINNRI